MTERTAWEAQQREVVADLERKTRSVQAALEQIRVRVPSRNGELGVTVDARGHVLDIRLTPQALRLGEVGLARALVETMKRAEKAAAQQAAEAAAPLTSDPRIAETLSASRRLLDETAASRRGATRSHNT
ncbi:YbaB/EbfC family nucleoid-associated protein [Nocardia sp. CA-129566]|uniref:YbaB/EbfC family nucleoid-associated protein n=1 Tax=Nocardia sp. CA-129566 TaxID=3239976 RepID=UPI003D95BAF7